MRCCSIWPGRRARTVRARVSGGTTTSCMANILLPRVWFATPRPAAARRHGGCTAQAVAMASESKTAVAAALAGNTALMLLKAVAAATTGSAAMLAETFHSLADTGNQILLFVGMRLSERPPDRTHPFGYGMNTYFWAFVVSAMLFTLGGAFAIWEAVHKFMRPAENAASPAAFFVLAGAFVFEALSLAVALHSAHGARRGRPLLRFVRETRDPTLPTVLLEDSAALASIIVAVAGLGLTRMTGEPRWDAVASALIGLLLIAVATFLAYKNYSLLLGKPATAELQRVMFD